MENRVETGLGRRRPVSALTARLTRIVMRAAGWSFVGEPPDVPKYVLIAAPHTSNWDFFVMLSLDLAYRVGSVWMGKESIFRGPLAPFFRRLGGIPIDRGSKNNVVEQAVEVFDRSERMVLAISPEGTRSRSRRWKTGFYYIALGAGVPLVFGFMDYQRKVVGFGPSMAASGDIEADLQVIRGFYGDITGKFPDNCGEVSIAACAESDVASPEAGLIAVPQLVDEIDAA